MTFTFREVVALILLALFAAVLAINPHDDHLIGAVLMGFAAAWGFYLGGSKTGADTAAMNATTVSATAAAASTPPAPAMAPDPAPAAPAAAAPSDAQP